MTDLTCREFKKLQGHSDNENKLALNDSLNWKSWGEGTLEQMGI